MAVGAVGDGNGAETAAAGDDGSGAAAAAAGGVGSAVSDGDDADAAGPALGLISPGAIFVGAVIAGAGGIGTICAFGGIGTVTGSAKPETAPTQTSARASANREKTPTPSMKNVQNLLWLYH